MIKINLLPQPNTSEGSEQERKTPISRVMGVAGVLVILGMCWMWTLALDRELQTLVEEKVAKEQLSKEWKKQSQQLELVQKKHKVLVSRSNLLERSGREKLVPVTLMDVISRSVEPLSLWLHRVSVNGEIVEIDGRGGKAEDVVTFVDRLERSPVWRNLLEIETRTEPFQGLPVFQFSLKFTVAGQEFRG